MSKKTGKKRNIFSKLVLISIIASAVLIAKKRIDNSIDFWDEKNWQ